MNDHSGVLSTIVSEPGVATPAKQAAILDAALELFSERTFEGTAMPVLAGRAGVGAGTIYRYFPSKEALVNALYQRWKLAFAEAISPPLPDGVSTRAQFGVLWRRLVDFARANPVAFTFLETHHHAGYLDDESAAISDEIDQPLLAWIREGQRTGVLRPGSPDALLALAYGAFVGLFKTLRRQGRPLSAATAALSEDAVWALLTG